MPRLEAALRRPDYRPAFDQYYRQSEQQMEAAALRATDRGRTGATRTIRQQMQSAGLGRLGNAIGSTSDLARGRSVHRLPGGGFSASGTVHIRSRSPRTIGAIEAYTQGAEIRPVRSRWLWIPTDEIPRVTARQRMTPALYVRNGFERKIGPLVRIASVNGNPLLIARNIGVSEAGRSRSAKSLTKSGRPRKGQRLKEFVVAFIGIPRTSRAARVDVSAIMRSVADQLPAMWEAEMRSGRGARGS